MKASFISILLFVFLGLPALLTAQYHFIIKGYIDNKDEHSPRQVTSGDTVTLEFLNMHRRDTALIKGDTFIMSGQVPYPSIAMLEYKYGGSLILIDNSEYEYSLKLEKLEGKNRMYKPEIKTNSPFHMCWKEFQDNKGRLIQKKMGLLDLSEKTKDKDSVLYYKSNIKDIDAEIAKSYKELAVSNRNIYATAYIVPAAPDFSYDAYQDIYNALPDSVKNTFYGKNFRDRLFAFRATESSKETEHPVSLPAIVGVDTGRHKVILGKQFFEKNKYTLIEFWASWCGPCRTVSQELRQRKDEFKKANMELVGFSLDMTAEPWRSAVAMDKTGWTEISDLRATESPIVKFLNITSIPSNIIVDSSGKIVRKNIYGKELDEFLSGRLSLFSHL